MAHTKVSQSPNVLALLLVLLASGACAVPMGPLMGFGGFGAGLLGPAGFGAKQNSMGRSYSCGASFGSCARGKEEYNMIWVKEPTMLSAVTRTMADGNIDGLKAVIKDSQAGRQNNNQCHGPHGPAGLGKAGLGAGYGLGLGGLGYAGGFGSYGLMGALGGFGGLHGGLGMGMGNEPRLELRLEVMINQLDMPMDVLLVFTSAVNQDLCTPESLGPVLTGPEHSMNGGGYGGFASPLMMHHGGGAGSLGAGGMGMGMYPGHPGTENLEREFGVIAQLRVQQGSNSFKINGLGEFKRLKDLAGRGMALCQDVVMGMEGKPVCTGKTFKVLFCSRLGYSIVEPMLMPPQNNGGTE